VNCHAVLLKRVQRSEGKLIICKPSKEGVRTCKDYVTGREITTVLKIAVDNVILELYDSCDYFASPLLMEKNQLNLIMTFNSVIIVAFASFMPIHIPKKVPG